MNGFSRLKHRLASALACGIAPVFGSWASTANAQDATAPPQAAQAPLSPTQTIVLPVRAAPVVSYQVLQVPSSGYTINYAPIQTVQGMPMRSVSVGSGALPAQVQAADPGTVQNRALQVALSAAEAVERGPEAAEAEGTPRSEASASTTAPHVVVSYAAVPTVPSASLTVARPRRLLTRPLVALSALKARARSLLPRPRRALKVETAPVPPNQGVPMRLYYVPGTGAGMIKRFFKAN